MSSINRALIVLGNTALYLFLVSQATKRLESGRRSLRLRRRTALLSTSSGGHRGLRQSHMALIFPQSYSATWCFHWRDFRRQISSNRHESAQR